MTHIVKRHIKAVNDVSRSVRIPSETADGKPEVKTVLAYDIDAIDTLNVQSMLVRAPTQPHPRGATQRVCGPQP